MYLSEGFAYYLKSLLFVRPTSRILKRFIRRVLMHQHYEFSPCDVFMVFNRDVGALLALAPRHYVYAWKYEEEPTNLFKCLLEKLGPGIFIDVGAYVGFHTILAAKHGWRVVSFEPNPLSLLLLRYNISLHRVEDRVRVIGKGAGDKHGYAVFTIASNPPESSFTRYLRNELRFLDVIVEVVTIDSVVESLEINGVNLVLKVDVEGFGLNVLKGAMRTIEEFKPFILFEIHRTFDEEDEIYALRILKDVGYDFTVLEPRSVRSFIVYA